MKANQYCDCLCDQTILSTETVCVFGGPGLTTSQRTKGSNQRLINQKLMNVTFAYHAMRR